MPRQLNIRSDEAYDTARILAEHFGKTTTEIVVEALRAHKIRTLSPSRRIVRSVAEADRLTLARMIAEANRTRPDGASSDHRDLYDDDGLPG